MSCKWAVSIMPGGVSPDGLVRPYTIVRCDLPAFVIVRTTPGLDGQCEWPVCRQHYMSLMRDGGAPAITRWSVIASGPDEAMAWEVLSS